MVASLAKMDVNGLLELRSKVDTELQNRAQQIRTQLDSLDSDKRTKRGPGRMSLLKGTKVPPKYRGPNGETWAGRGATPVWMRTLLKKGRKMESYRIKDV